MRDKLVTLLKVRPDETRLVALMAVLFITVQAGQGIGENAAFTLFLARLDVNILPYMYMGLGVVAFIAASVYSASLSRFQNASVVLVVLAGTALLFLAEWAAIVFFNLQIYVLVWLTTFGMSVVLGTLVWTVAGEVCDARTAKRLFPLFTSMGILGSVLGNGLTGVVARYGGTEALVLVYATLLLIAFVVARSITDGYFVTETIPSDAQFSPLADIRTGYAFARGSGLFRLVAVTSILYSVLFFAVDFPFSETLSLQYANDEAGLAGFKGAFSSVTTIVTFAVSLLLANRLYTRLGIVNSLLIMPVTYLIGFGVFYFFFGFQGAVFARFSQLVVLGGLLGTAWNALFNVVPIERRGQVMAFNNGVPAQIGVVVSGVLIILGKQFLDTQVVLLIGAGVAVVVLYLTWRMVPAYGQALVDALRAGQAEVFDEDRGAFANYQNDPAAVQIVINAMNDPKSFTRRLAIEMLAKMDVRLAIPDMLGHLIDNDPEVRATAIRALAHFKMTSLTDSILRGLDDPDDNVRKQTLAVLPTLEVASSSTLIRTLSRLLKGRNSALQAQAASVMVYFGDAKKPVALLNKLLHSPTTEERLHALDAFMHIAQHTKPSNDLPFNLKPILVALKDESALVRQEAIRVAVSLYRYDDEIVPAIVKRLEDENIQVRRAASESLKQVWAQARSVLIPILEKMDGVVVDAALDAIPPDDKEIEPTLRRYIQGEVANIRHLRILQASLPAERGPVVRLLAQTLHHRETVSEERAVKAVGLFGNPQAMRLVRRSLNAGDSHARAAALEALETLGDKEITAEILPILDRGGVLKGNDEILPVYNVWLELMKSRDYWLRALAARSASEVKLKTLYPVLRVLRNDPVQFVRRAARVSLANMEREKTKMETMKTLSSLERILLLREVPMFSTLSPEDLEKIAEIASEQSFANRDVLCEEGDPGSTLFIIVNGRADVSVTINGKESVIASRGPGEFVGEMAIFESAPRSATVQAKSKMRVLAIEGDVFNTILLERPQVAVSALRYMSSRIREMTEKLS